MTTSAVNIATAAALRLWHEHGPLQVHAVRGVDALGHGPSPSLLDVQHDLAKYKWLGLLALTPAQNSGHCRFLCRLGLDELYAAGGRKFMVASIAAAYLVPQAIHAAQEVATLNPAYSGVNNPVTQYLIALTVQSRSPYTTMY